MTRRPRVVKRSLVRWNDDHDKELLLWIDSCCRENGIRIPYDKIASCMGSNFTEGAIVQHLAKLRSKCEDAGLHVPMSIKRGTVTRPTSSVYGRKSKAPVPRRPDTAARQKKRRRASKLSEDEAEEEAEEDEMDELPLIKNELDAESATPRRTIRSRPASTRSTSYTTKSTRQQRALRAFEPYPAMITGTFDQPAPTGTQQVEAPTPLYQPPPIEFMAEDDSEKEEPEDGRAMAVTGINPFTHYSGPMSSFTDPVNPFDPYPPPVFTNSYAPASMPYSQQPAFAPGIAVPPMPDVHTTGYNNGSWTAGFDHFGDF